MKTKQKQQPLYKNKKPIHPTHSISAENEKEAIVLVNGENTFSSINRKVLLHNVEYLCLVIMPLYTSI